MGSPVSATTGEWDVPYWRNPWMFYPDRHETAVCRIGTYSRGRSQEVRVVGSVVGALLGLGIPAADIRLEFPIAKGERVDVAVPARLLFIECKGYRIDRAALRQAVRYLAAARDRWPAGEPHVILAAPSVDRALVPPMGITTAEIRAAS